jgi:hypothetical protein
MGGITKTIGLWLLGRTLQRRFGGTGRGANIAALVALLGQFALASSKAGQGRKRRAITEPQSGVRLWG